MDSIYYLDEHGEVRDLRGIQNIPEPVPTDLRERALRLKQNRGTGPGKPVQDQRRDYGKWAR